MKINPIKSHIIIDQAEIAAFCRKHHIRRLALFGSVLRNDFAADSDIDILVEFEANHVPGLAFFGMENELSQLLGRSVDLNTPNFLSQYFRDKVLREAQVQYEAV
jgi:predicted nucleotidyltransferase